MHGEESCSCQVYERLAIAGIPIVADPTSGDLVFYLPDGRALFIRYCFSCGRQVASQRGAMESAPSSSEMHDTWQLLMHAATISDVEAILGGADERVTNEGIHFRENELSFRQQMVYSTQWKSFDLVVIETDDGNVRLLFRPKYLGT